jgi:hypothetical protein
VTKKTYEAQMFEIASKKLGMHHAVFETGGVRKDFDGNDDGNDMLSLMSLDKEKVEMMIRYGAYAIMNNDEEDPENAKINQINIEDVLSASRTIRYDIYIYLKCRYCKSKRKGLYRSLNDDDFIIFVQNNTKRGTYCRYVSCFSMLLKLKTFRHA